MSPSTNDGGLLDSSLDDYDIKNDHQDDGIAHSPRNLDYEDEFTEEPPSPDPSEKELKAASGIPEDELEAYNDLEE